MNKEEMREFSPRRKYLVGVSGGADSMALLDILRRLGYGKLVVCHFTHGLREHRAQAEAEIVAAAAQSGNYGFEHGIGDTAAHAQEKKISIEMAARELRLQFFETCARRHRCSRIFLAHHADDQIETILNNLFRGTGLAGLAGIRKISRIGRLDIIRPLLKFTRREIRDYISENKIVFSEDESNAHSIHTRNKVRLQLIPAIEKIFGMAAGAALLRMADTARYEEEFLVASTPRLDHCASAAQLRNLPIALRRRAILDWLRLQGIEAGFSEVLAVDSLLDVKNPAKINLPANRHARRRAGKIFLE